jgi:hypothetical protein
LQNSIAEYFNYYFNIYIKGNTNQIFEEWANELNIIGKEVLILENMLKAKIIEILEDSRFREITNDSNDEIIIDNGNSIRYQFD